LEAVGIEPTGVSFADFTCAKPPPNEGLTPEYLADSHDLERVVRDRARGIVPMPALQEFYTLK
jgi:hypothetical protein